MPGPGYLKPEDERPDYEKKQRKAPHTRKTKVVEGVVIKSKGVEVIIDPKEVYKVAKLWCTWNEMAEWFGLPVETFKFNFRDIVVKARNETKQFLRREQIKVALTGNVPMLIWLGKQVLGQLERPEELFEEKEPVLSRDEIDERIRQLVEQIKDQNAPDTQH